MAHILVVDDEIGIRELLSEILADEGHDVRLAENAACARAARDAARPDLVLLDIWMPDTDGITLLKEWSANGQLNMPVIMMSGHGTIDTAIEATRVGALDFLEKPIALQKLLAAVKKSLSKPTTSNHAQLSLTAFTRPGPLRDLRKQLEQLATNQRALLLKSPTDGITELVARTLQSQDKRWLDLAQFSTPITTEMLEEHRGGILYAEELARLSRPQQKNLLFAAERLNPFDLHLIAASSVDDSALMAAGWEDAQLKNVFDVRLGIPSLSELHDEIPDLASLLLTQYIETAEIPLRHFSTAALNALRQHAWPGGYKELKNAVKSLALSALEEEIGVDEVSRLLTINTPNAMQTQTTHLANELMELPLREAREAFERLYFEHHLSIESGNIARLAEKTGLERTHLYRKLKDLGLRN